VRENSWKLPVASGVLVVLGHYTSLLVPNFVSFLPMLWWLDTHRERPIPDLLRGGVLFGLTTYGIGLHWIRRLNPAAPPNSKRAEDQLFSTGTVGHGSFSGCIFIIDLEQQLVITQVRRQNGPRYGEWSSRFLQTVAEAVKADPAQVP